jgi:hypothetical protein
MVVGMLIIVVSLIDSVEHVHQIAVILTMIVVILFNMMVTALVIVQR